MRNLDKTHSDTWATRVKTLKGISYSDYLQSEEWKEIKAKASKRLHYQSCVVCGSKDSIELHHMSYKIIGTTDLRNVRALCRNCHQAVHDYAKSSGKSVRLATRYIRRQHRNLISREENTVREY